MFLITIQMLISPNNNESIKKKLHYYRALMTTFTSVFSIESLRRKENLTGVEEQEQILNQNKIEKYKEDCELTH